jgi:phage shock protein C
MIAGICSGFAAYYGWDISLVRVVTAGIALLTSGFGVLAYLAAWIIIPEAPYMLPPAAGYGAPVPPPSPGYGGPTDSTGSSTGTPAV